MHNRAGTFHETAKVVNSLFGETLRIAELRPTNCQLAFERSHRASPFLYVRYFLAAGGQD
jgi:hypothetical protein